jgi:dTDP-4-dehydrorhamnose reductase
MPIAVTGANGQLGGELCQRLGDAALPLDVDTLDLTAGAAVTDALVGLRPDLVIHCAAYTQVDLAETEPELCRTVNTTAVEQIARACGILDCPLVQISTDYVFGTPPIERRPWRETDRTSPQGVYARTKRDGELAAARHSKHLIIRTCGLYARLTAPRASNFVKTMLRLGRSRSEVGVVNDQYCTPTYVPHLAEAILWLAGVTNDRPSPWGTYHVTNAGQTTWCEFAKEIFRLSELDVKVRPITTAKYASPAARPAYSVLDTSRYQSLGGPSMPDWRAALAECLALSSGVDYRHFGNSQSIHRAA